MDSASLVDYIQVILLGAIQGIAEFLPISSKGHLVVFGKLFERLFATPASEQGSLALIVALHIGTLGSILVVYRSDLRKLLWNPRLCLWIVVATIPAALVGLTLKKHLEALFEQPVAAACGWLVTAALLWHGQRRGKEDRELPAMRAGDAITVGLFQAFALLPGISRSGTTIVGGLLTGLKRESATTFSFLIAIPAIAGAMVVGMAPVVRECIQSGTGDLAALLGGHSAGAVVTGMIVSFVVGVVALRWLVRVIVQRGLDWFVFYLVAASVLTFAWQAWEALTTI